MKDVRKVPASAGAEWVLGGFRLLRQSPVGFGALGLVYGLIALVVSLSAQRSTPLALLLELVLVVVGPVLIGGMVFAARSIDGGGHAAPEQLLQAVRDGKVLRLLATLLPQVIALLVCAVLLVLLVGGDQLQAMAQTIAQMQAQANPDPALAASLPIGRLMLWLLLVCVIGIGAGFFTFFSAPEIMFTDSTAFDAMRRSFHACVRNLPALLVFLVLAAIAAIAVYVAVMLIALVARIALGPAAMEVVAQLLSTAVLMPVITGAMYVGWKQMLADAVAATRDTTIAL